MTLTLRKISETATEITLGWTPVAGAVGYRFTREKAPEVAVPSGGTRKVYSHTYDPKRNQATFAKDSAWYSVEVLGAPESAFFPPPPAPAGFPIPQYRIPVVDAAGQGNTWCFHTSPTTLTYPWGSSPIRHLTIPGEWWGLFEVEIAPDWNVAADGGQYAILDLHGISGEKGWNDVSPMHLKYESGHLMLQHQGQTDFGKPHEFVVVPNMSKGRRHFIVVNPLFARPGRTRVWVDGSDDFFDTGPAYTMYANTTKLAVLEGHYCMNNRQNSSFILTASRWGRTLPEALADSDIRRVGFQGRVPEILAPRSSSDFVLPPSLGG